MISKYSKFALAVPMALALGACDKGFDALNTNPNNATVANPAYILTNAERANIFRLFDVPANQDGGELIIQHWAKVQYTDEDRYAFRSTTYQSIWDGFYAAGLADFNELIRIGKETNNPNMQAVGLVLRSYFFSVLTDLYGDIPYSQALRLEENVLIPKYDTQEQVYLGLLADLKQASTLATTGGSVDGDIIYNGDMERWRKFANSLRLRLAMRLSDAKADVAKAEVAALLNGSTPMISSNAENAMFRFLGSSPNANPVFENRQTRDDHRVSRSLVSYLRRRNDPRLAIYANRPESGDSAAFYRGVRNGLTNSAAASLGPLTSTSKVGSYFTAANAPGVLQTYAEVKFLRAEAIARGYVTAGSAETEYNEAVTASMAQYGITGADVVAYLAQPNVAYNAANYKESIGIQKWIALYGQGVEAWSEWRRLDYPVLPRAASPVAAAQGKIPVRFRYPANEQTINTANRAEAVARQGADLITTKIWWDKL